MSYYISALSSMNNFNKLSFKGDTTRKNSAKEDVFIKSLNTETSVSKKIKKNAAAMFFALVTVLGLYNSSNSSNVVTIPYNNETNTDNLSNTYGVSKKAIAYYNTIEEHSPNEIKIPSSFNYLNKNIQILNDNLYRKGITPEIRKSMEHHLNALKEKQSNQKSVAEMFADDNYIYFLLNMKNSDYKYVEENGDKKYIKAENFKKLFDIKEGALRNNNQLPFNWRKADFADITKQYMDYTDTILYDKQIYKVAKNDIDTKHINLDDYLNKK